MRNGRWTSSVSNARCSRFPRKPGSSEDMRLGDRAAAVEAFQEGLRCRPAPPPTAASLDVGSEVYAGHQLAAALDCGCNAVGVFIEASEILLGQDEGVEHARAQ